MRDVFDTVPAMLKESGYGLRCHDLGKSFGTCGGAAFAGGHRRRNHALGWGALGETMAVTFVIGNAHRISSSLLAPGTTISSAIANEFTRSGRRRIVHLFAHIVLGLLLFLITFTVIAAAQAMLRRLERRSGAVV